MERIIEFTPAFDKRHSEPSKNYGIHGVEIRFVLKGAEGAVQFVLFTNWQLPHVTKEHLARPITDATAFYLPIPADLGYHSPKPFYDRQKPVADGKPCPYLDGRPCYYDGSSLNAEPVFERLLKEGSDGVWATLEEFYAETFVASKVQ